MNEHCAIILSSLKALTTTLRYSHIVCGLCISYNKNKLLALFYWRLGDLIHLTSFLIARDVQFRLILDGQDYIFCLMDLDKILTNQFLIKSFRIRLKVVYAYENSTKMYNCIFIRL